MRWNPLWSLVLVVAFARLSASLWAGDGVVRFEITGREPFADGYRFGTAGAYERIAGRVHYAVDPAARQNRAVTDIDLAPRHGQGRIEFSGDLLILAPADLSKGNGALLYDVNNRGNLLALRMFNDAPGGNDPRTRADAGHGFLMQAGYIVVWSGWDGELLPGNGRLRLSAPTARLDGGRLTGPVRCEIVPTDSVTRIDVNWANHGSYRPTPRGLETATLTRRERPGDARVLLPRDQWALHVTDIASDNPWQLPRIELEVPAGLERGHIYELIYEGQDPLVQGLGFAALRDLIAAFRDGSGGDNPLRINGDPAVQRAYAFGVSQSGRFLREFLYWGFNEDLAGRRVFDGVMPHVAGGGLGSFNHRFAQPTRHVTQHDHHDYPADRFPFAYETQCDPLSGRVDGILRRAELSGTAPLVMHTQSAAEYWTRSGSLPHTDPLGCRDACVPANVRFYTFGGTQHGPSGFPPTAGQGQNLANPGDYRPFLRALLVAMDRAVREGVVPPPSVYPQFADGTLTAWDQASTGFPSIPGVRYPGVIQQPSWWDYGPRWAERQIIDRQPPARLADYRVRVARCDADGNELGTLLPPEVAVPVATHTGWNLRRADAGAENELVSLAGSYIPFATKQAEREASGDPRLSIEERYGALDEYLSRLAAQARSLEAAGYLLPADVERVVSRQRERVAPLFESLQDDR